MATDNWDYEPTEEAPENEPEPALKYEIMNYPADTTLAGYLAMFDREELKIPDFQRDYVWDQVRASKLIESFLLGLPVPGVFLFKERQSPKYLVIDGQQRIQSVVRYMKGYFDEKVFRLKNVDVRWEGKKFSEISEDDQFRLNGSVLRSTIIQQISPDDKTSIYQIFERLNTGGVNLNPMEIRQCVSHGPFVIFLKEMNKNKSWRKILGKTQIDRRLRDVELVLRCVALAVSSDSYEKPMKGFLNKFMELQRNNDESYDEIAEKFYNACEIVVENLGEKPFHLRGRLNYGVLDSTIATLFHVNDVSDLKKKFDSMLDDPKYIPAITANTSDASEVQTRLRIAKEKICDGQ